MKKFGVTQCTNQCFIQMITSMGGPSTTGERTVIQSIYTFSDVGEGELGLEWEIPGFPLPLY